MSVLLTKPEEADAATPASGPGAPTPPVAVSDGDAAPVATPAPADAAVDRRRQASWLLGAHARTALLAVLALLVGVLLVKPATSGTGQDFTVTANAINVAMTGQTGVTSSSGGYLPGTGIVLVSAVTGVETTGLNGLLATAMGPFAAQLAALPDNEALSWQSTLTAANGTTSTWLIRVARDDVADQSKWVAVPVATGTTGSGSSAAGAAAAGSTATGATTAGAAAADSTATGAATTATVATSAAAASSGATSAAASASAAPATGGATGSDGAATTAAAAAGVVTGPQSDDFSTDAAAWTALTGTWKVVDGAYQQTDAAGYDYISQFNSVLPAAYTVSVKLKGIGDTINGGLIVGQPATGSRKGAYIIDLASKDYIRWGQYDTSSGTYKFIGGAALGSAQAATDAHTLAITVKADGSTVSWDSKQVGTFVAVTPGYAGLVTSQSAVSFDDFTVTAS